MPAIACTSCKRSLTVAEGLVGKPIKCPSCATIFVATVNGTGSNGSAPAPVAAKPPAAAASKSVTLPCNQCKKPLTIPETLLGKGVKCPQCAAVFTALAPGVKSTAAQAPKPTNVTAPATVKAITLPCNQCKKPLTIPETLLGKGVKCPQCAAVFTAQAPGKPVAPPTAGKPPSLAPTAPTAPTAAQPGLVNLACEACKKPLRLPDKLIGSAVKCPHCAGVFTAKKPGSPAPSAAPPAATKPTAPAAPPLMKPTAPVAAAKPPAPPPAPAKPPVSTAPVAAKPPAPPANTPKAPPAAAGEPKVTIHCVRCKRPLRLPETALGKPLRCPRCRMIFAAKPKPPDAASWVNYPLEKPVEDRNAPGPKGSPESPPAAPGKVVRVESLGAPPPPVRQPEPLAPAASTPATPEEVTDWESVTQPGLEEAAAHAPISHGEPVAEIPVEPLMDDVPVLRLPDPSSTASTESAEDVFAQHLPKKKKKKKLPPPPPPEEVPPAEPEYAAESADAEPIPFAPESEVAQGEAEVSEDVRDGDEVAEGDEAAPAEGEDKSGGSAAKWFAVGLFLGGLSAAGVGALFVFHVVQI
jgi:DNA-directed RNA polymerase subunit RPC12/RpoP